MDNKKSCLCQILIDINKKGAVSQAELVAFITNRSVVECDKQAVADVLPGLLMAQGDKYVLNQKGQAKLQQCLENPA